MRVEKFDKDQWLKRVVWPKRDSRKGENGRVLVIGGSSLFHAAPFWAANAASRIVDMVHFSSPYLLNNKLVEERAKRGFWNGIVVPWEEVERYVEEDGVVLIGPGMMRSHHAATSDGGRGKGDLLSLDIDDTKGMVGYLLRKYPKKKWVVDGGALQEMEVEWLNEKMIITPNGKELEMLFDRLQLQAADRRRKRSFGGTLPPSLGVELLVQATGATVVAKGVADYVCSDERRVTDDQLRCVIVEGGYPGMTKGGTGDVLAGIVAGLYAKNTAMTAAVVGSWLNKRIGEKLGREQVFFNASDMAGLVDSR